MMNLPFTVFSMEISTDLINGGILEISKHSSLTPKQYSMVLHRYQKIWSTNRLLKV